jgi:hypothetical protein
MQIELKTGDNWNMVPLKGAKFSSLEYATAQHAHNNFVVITTIDATKETRFVYPCPEVRPPAQSTYYQSEELTLLSCRFLRTRLSISTNSLPLPRLRNPGPLGSPLLTKMETAPLRLRTLSQMATRSPGVPALLPRSTATLPRLDLPLPILLPCLSVLPPAFPVPAAVFSRRLPA